MSSCFCPAVWSCHFKEAYASGYSILFAFFIQYVQITSVDHASQHLQPPHKITYLNPHHRSITFSILSKCCISSLFTGFLVMLLWSRDWSQLPELCPSESHFCSGCFFSSTLCSNHIAQIAEYVDMFQIVTISQ